MEAKDLMIGDYVQTIREGIIYYGRVISLYEGRAIAKCIDSELTFEDEMEYVPLTEEILKANGFEKGLFSDTLALYEQIHHLDVVWDYVRNSGWIHVMNYQLEINFVHELQHALRLCGMNELADNFKLKEE